MYNHQIYQCNLFKLTITQYAFFTNNYKQRFSTNKLKLRGIFKINTLIHFPFLNLTTKKVPQIPPNYSQLTTHSLLNVSLIMNLKIYIRVCINNISIPSSR